MKTSTLMKRLLLCLTILASEILMSCSSQTKMHRVLAASERIESTLNARHRSWTSLHRPVSLTVNGAEISMRVSADEVTDVPDSTGSRLLKGRVVAWVNSPDRGGSCITARLARYDPSAHCLHFEGLPYWESHERVEHKIFATDAVTIMDMNTESGSLTIRGPSHTSVKTLSSDESHR